MIERVANYLKKAIFPISRIFGEISLVTLTLLMLLVVVQVCSRRFFNAPIKGSLEISELLFSIIVFCPMAWCAIKDGHVDLSIIVVRFPKAIRRGVEVVILFITTGVLGLTSWRLLSQGIRLQTMHEETSLLGIPMYPFLYLATLGFLLMTLVFLIKFFCSLGNIVERR